jgi:alpha-L-arabinofuranosidase
MDDRLMIDYDIQETTESEAYQTVSTDGTGDIIIKLVNETGSAKTFAAEIKDAGALTGSAAVETVAAGSVTADNILGRPEAVTLETSVLEGITDRFNYTVPPYSVTVLRLHRQERR